MSQTPPWYTEGDLVASLTAADRVSDLSTSEIVDVLAEHEFDADQERIRTVIEQSLEIVTSQASTKGTSDPLASPRERVARFADPADVEYLSAREFARVLGVVLSRYEGSHRIPGMVDDLDVDLFWNRAQTTVAFRTVPQADGAPVEEALVDTVAHGDTTPQTGRSPSLIGIVSNGGFTDDARALATANEIELFGSAHLTQWFTDARLTPKVFGAILEEGEQRESDLDDQIASLPSLPDPVQERDPLADVTETPWTADDSRAAVRPRPTVKQRIPITETQPEPGTHGQLYADPADDGDFDAFDRYLDELTTDGDSA